MPTDDLKERINREIARKRIEQEISRRRGDPVGEAVRKTNAQPSGDEDPLAYRGNILPLGRTREGKIVPAIPEPFVEGGRELKGAVTQGKYYDPAQTAGPASLGVGGSPAIRGGRGALPKLGPKPEVQTTEGLGIARTGAYGASEAAGVVIPAEGLKGFVLSLMPGMKDAGINKGLHPEAWGLLEHIVDQAGLGPKKKAAPEGLEALLGQRTPDQPITLKELDQLRQLARENIKSSKKDSEIRVNQILIEKIDDFILGLKDEPVEKLGDAAVRLKDGRVFTGKNHSDAINAAIKATGGGVEFAKGGQGLFQTSKGRIISYKEAVDLPTESSRNEQGVSQLMQGRELALRKSKAEEIDTALTLAVSRSGEQRASGMENAWRNEFKKIYDREIKKKSSKYTAEELEGLKEAATTSNAQRGLVTLGKLSPTAGVMGMLTAATSGEIALYMQRPWMLGIPAGLYVARYAATKMRENSSRSVEELIKGGRPISDYRFQQALRTRGRLNPRLGAMGGIGMLPKPQQQQPDQFNPLLNPGAT